MSGIVLDSLTLHNEDLGIDNSQVIGYFHGTPIVEWNPQTTLSRETKDRRARIAQSKVYAQEHPGGDDELPV